MTGFFANLIIDIPEYDKQKEVIIKYEKLDRFEAKIRKINTDINSIKQKSSASG